MRRAKTSLLSFIVVSAVSIVSVGHPRVASAGAPPNVLLIVSDDQRTDTLGMMPAVHRSFTQAGTTFTNAFATTPLCCPSRASLLTGAYTHNHGVDDNEGGEEVITIQDSMIQAALADRGYRSGLFGKFLNGFPNEVDPSHVDRWALTPRMTFSGAEWNVNGTLRTIQQNSTSFIGDRALGFLDETEASDATPWFAYVGFMAPHMPATVEPRYEDAPLPPFTWPPGSRERDRSDKPTWVRHHELPTRAEIEAKRKPQLRSLIALDDQIARLMGRLDALGETANTLAIFLSDNGMLWGEHGRFGKILPYEPSISVPLLMAWPGHLPSGAIDSRLVGLLDVATTIMSATGSTARMVQDGIDLLDRAAVRSRILLEFTKIPRLGVDSWKGYRTERQVYVEYRNAGHLTFREFYRLDKDPYQKRNRLLDGDPSNDPLISNLHRRLKDLVSCAGSACVV